SLVGKRVLRKADYIISVSKWAAGDIGHYGIPRSKITVIRNGIDAKVFKPGSGKSFRRKHGITGRMLLFVGRVIRQKGLDYLVAAMPEILCATPDTKLVIIGRGNRLEHVRKRVKKLGLENNVVFPGFVNERELKAALRECDAFVLPSLWEVLPVSILEAMASGKPIVCTDAGGNRELVQNGFNGFVVPKRDPKALAHAVARVLRDEKLRKKMGRNSRRKAVAEFSWNRIAALTIDLYRNAVAGCKRAPTTNGTAALARLSQELSHRKLKFENYLESFETQWKKLFKTSLDQRGRLE
ncbi:MAG: glycosyltransferase family 4 protein, partial [Candidatus Micrarchaeota archaeon]